MLGTALRDFYQRTLSNLAQAGNIGTPTATTIASAHAQLLNEIQKQQQQQQQASAKPPLPQTVLSELLPDPKPHPVVTTNSPLDLSKLTQLSATIPAFPSNPPRHSNPPNRLPMGVKDDDKPLSGPLTAPRVTEAPPTSIAPSLAALRQYELATQLVNQQGAVTKLLGEGQGQFKQFFFFFFFWGTLFLRKLYLKNFNI